MDKVKPIGTKENSTFLTRAFSEKNAASIIPKLEESHENEAGPLFYHNFFRKAHSKMDL